MSRWALLLSLLAAWTVLAGTSANPAQALPPPEHVRVEGGQETWHPELPFSLHWQIPAAALAEVGAVHLRLRTMGGSTLSESRLAGPVQSGSLGNVWPGEYTAEVWLEANGGAQGPPAAVMLRFDDTAPGPVTPIPASEWVGRSGIPVPVRLQHDFGALSPSGIRGYAVSVDRDPDAGPCADASLCTDAETDLRQGVGGDSIALYGLVEGTDYVHAVAVSGAGLHSEKVGTAAVRVDLTSPEATLEGLPSGWASGPVEVVAHATDRLSGVASTAIQIDGRTPTEAIGGTARALVSGEGVHRIAYFGRDRAGNADDGAKVNGARNHLPDTATVRIDEGAPRLAFANRLDPADPELIAATVSDPLSGPDGARGSIQVRRRSSGDPFRPLATTVVGPLLLARWDSDSYPEGEYEFRAVGFDAAGNRGASTQRANGAAMLLQSPLKRPTRLELAFPATSRPACRRAGRRRHSRSTRDCRKRQGHGAQTQRTVSLGSSVSVVGRLLAGSNGLAGRPVRVLERFSPGATGAVRASTVLTAADGSFRLPLHPGPSRLVTVSFAGDPTLARSESPPVQLAVRSAVSMRASRHSARVGGAPVVFSGRVRGPAAEVAGRSVQLRFRVPGLGGWSEFRTVQSGPGGRFRYAYRFADDDSRGVRFQFRAVVPTQSGWPYESGSSRPVAVLGR
jgi:hypothetical protein